MMLNMKHIETLLILTNPPFFGPNSNFFLDLPLVRGGVIKENQELGEPSKLLAANLYHNCLKLGRSAKNIGLFACFLIHSCNLLLIIYLWNISKYGGFL